MKMSNEELLAVSGGISASYLTAFAKIFTTIIEIGKMVGTSIRRSINKSYC